MHGQLAVSSQTKNTGPIIWIRSRSKTLSDLGRYYLIHGISLMPMKPMKFSLTLLESSNTSKNEEEAEQEVLKLLVTQIPLNMRNSSYQELSLARKHLLKLFQTTWGVQEYHQARSFVWNRNEKYFTGNQEIYNGNELLCTLEPELKLLLHSKRGPTGNIGDSKPHNWMARKDLKFESIYLPRGDQLLFEFQTFGRCSFMIKLT